MHPDLEKLIALQQVDGEVARLREEIAALPRRVAVIEAKLAGTRAQIEKRNPATIADLMRMVPGLRVDCRGVVCRVTSLRGGRNCVPAYYMDGIPTDPAAVWMTPPKDLEGIEIYTGPSETPPELEHRASCGAIVLWTRLPPERVPKPKPADTAGAGAAIRP